MATTDQIIQNTSNIHPSSIAFILPRVMGPKIPEV